MQLTTFCGTTDPYTPRLWITSTANRRGTRRRQQLRCRSRSGTRLNNLTINNFCWTLHITRRGYSYTENTPLTTNEDDGLPVKFRAIGGSFSITISKYWGLLIGYRRNTSAHACPPHSRTARVRGILSSTGRRLCKSRSVKWSRTHKKCCLQWGDTGKWRFIHLAYWISLKHVLYSTIKLWLILLRNYLYILWEHLKRFMEHSFHLAV